MSCEAGECLARLAARLVPAIIRSSPFLRPDWRICLLVVLLGARVTAADRVPVETVPTDSSLTHASAQLAEARAANAQPTQPVQTPPGISVPPLQTVPAAPRSPGTVPRTEGEMPGRESANWLVDSMMRDAQRSPGSRRGRAGKPELPGSRAVRSLGDRTTNRPPGSFLAATSDRGVESDEPSPEQTPEEVTSDAARAGAGTTRFDPMAQYLAQWLSPGDFALLKPTLAPASADRPVHFPSGSTPETAGNGFDALVPGGVGLSADRPPVRSSARGGQDAPNPYLEFLQPPATIESSPPAALPPPPAPSAAAAPTLPDAGSSRPAAPSLQDVIKQRNDEKYYKPLKRF